MNKKPIHDDHIDIVGRFSNGCDLYESKHAASTQMDKIQTQIKKLNQITVMLVKQGYLSKYFLGTIEFINKSIICDNVDNLSSTYLSMEKMYLDYPLKNDSKINKKSQFSTNN